MTRRNLVATAVPSAIVAFLGYAIAQKASVPKKPDKAAIAEDHAMELLFLIDVDKNGKVSKQEWMKFMEAEFDRLDEGKKGELYPQELMRSRLRVSHKATAAVGK